MTLTKIGTDGVKDGSLLNADINASAAISKSKIENLINNNADNRVITGSGTANTLNAESNVVIDSAGRVLAGTSSARTIFKMGASGNGQTPKFQFETANDDSNNSLSLTYGRNNAFGAEIFIAKHRGASVGGTTIVQGGDRLGALTFTGSDGTNFQPAASIEAEIDATPGTDDMPGRLVFSTTADGAKIPTERMRIDSSGNVGIGLTSSPVSSNSEQGVFIGGADSTQSVIASNVTPFVINRIGTGGNDRNCIEFRNNGTLRGTIGAIGASNGIFFQNGTSEAMRIDSGGNILFGVTSETTTHASFRPNSQNRMILHIGSSSTGSSNLAIFSNPNGTVGSISTSGSATSFNTSSDYRLKENATAISDGITRLKTLKPYRFNFKADASTTVDGFFAHEVTAVPEAITGEKDAVDSDNNPVYQGIDQSKLVPLLTAALQEAITKIETLETKVAALEAA